MGVIETSGGAMGVDVRGAASAATPMLFLHGVGSDRSVWAPQLDYFGRQRQAVALDHPGYGESSFRPGATRDVFAAAAFETLDGLGIDRAVICGLSLGGVIAIAMHHLAADRCAALILADSFAVHPEGAAIHARSVDASRSLPMRQLAESRASFLLGEAASSDLRDEVIETMARVDPAAYRVGAAAVWLADQGDRAAAIACPTLILVGAEDRITPTALSQQLAAIVPAARLEVIAHAGHLANIEQPVAFNAAIDDFLAAHTVAIEGLARS